MFGDGTQTRSFCYVDDTVDGLLRLLGSGYADPVNLGNPNEMTIMAFAQAVQRLMGTHLPIEHRPLPEDDPKLRKPDITRAREVLGWEPRVAFDEGMTRTIDLVPRPGLSQRRRLASPPGKGAAPGGAAD